MNITHGEASTNRRTKEYAAWANMRNRCLSPKHKYFKYYGGRGITICERWKLYATFLQDMGRCPDGHSLDRKNNAGNYEPGNCHWATDIEQNNNKRCNRMLTWNGKTLTLAAWARETNQTKNCLWHRIVKLKWDLEKALTVPVQTK